MKKISFNTILNIFIVVLLLAFVGRYFYFQPKFQDGEDLPDFSATLLNGETMQLSDLRGNYVLVDFWGSWCGPCRAENPYLVALYNKYNGQQFKNADGFEIFSVGIEKKEDRWKRAIARDGLIWKYHVLDLTDSFKFFDSEIASQFGVRQLPSKYLLNEKGVIISVDPSIEELDAILGTEQIAKVR